MCIKSRKLKLKQISFLITMLQCQKLTIESKLGTTKHLKHKQHATEELLCQWKNEVGNFFESWKQRKIIQTRETH